MIKTAESLAGGRGFALGADFGKRLAADAEPKAMLGRGGRYYAKYAPLTPVVLMPAAAIGMKLGALAPAGSSSDFTVSFIAGFLNPIVTAAAAVAVFYLCAALGISARGALAAGLLFGLGTISFPYSKTTFSEPLAGLMTIACFAGLAVFRGGGGGRRAAAVVAAAAMLLPLSRLSAAVSLAPLALYALTGRDRFRATASLVSGAAAGIILYGLFNASRFGSFFETGYGAEAGRFGETFAAGLYGLLVSSDKSFFVYSPVLLLALPGLAAGLKRGARAEVFCVSGIFILNVLLYANWYEWGGGHCWGPRFLVPAAGVMCLGLGYYFDKPRGGVWRGLAAAAIAVSIVIQLSASFAKFVPQYENYTVRVDIDRAEAEGRLLRPGAPRFLPVRAQMRAAAEHAAYSVRNAAEYIKLAPAGSEALKESKLVENAPDEWFFLMWTASGAKLRAAAAVILAAMAALVAISLVSIAKIMKTIR